MTNKPTTASSCDESRGLVEVIKTSKGINVLRDSIVDSIFLGHVYMLVHTWS